MRVFIAIPLPDEIKDYLRDAQNELKKCDSYAKWVNTANSHLTLKFLGEVKEEKILNLENIVKETALSFSAFKVNFSNFGFFPNERNPHVFFIATDNENRLKEIAYFLEDRLEPLGFKKESRFRSHVTLARLKSKKNTECLVAKTKEIQTGRSLPVNQIILYKSILTPEGAMHEEILKAGLRE